MKIYLWVIGLLILISGCSSIDSNAVVATIGSENITYDEFEIYAAPQSRKPDLVSVSNKDKEQLLDKYVQLAAMAQLAVKEGLDKDKKYVDDLEKRKDVWVAQYFYWDFLANSLNTPIEIENYYKNMSKEFKVRHILVGYSGAQNSDVKRTKDECIELINSIYEEAIKDGVDFGELAKEKSEGPSKPRGGALPPFGIGKMAKPFEETVLQMDINEISKPVETKFGFHIIKLEEKSESTLQASLNNPNERVKAYQGIISLKKSEAQNLFTKTTDSLRQILGFSYYEDNLLWLSNKIKSSKLAGPPNLSKMISDEENLKKILFSVGDTEFSIGKMINEFGPRLNGMISRMNNIDGLKQILQGFSSMMVWSKAGHQKGYESKRWVQIQINNYKRVDLGGKYRTKVIRPAVTYSDEDIEDFYNRNITRYQIPAKIEISVIRQGDIEIAATALKRAVKGEDWKTLVREYSQGNESEKKRHGKLGFKKENSFGEVSKKAFEFGPHKVIPELVLNGNSFFIVKTGDKTEKKDKSIEKVRHDIESAVKLRNELSEMKKIVDDLKESGDLSIKKSAFLI